MGSALHVGWELASALHLQVSCRLCSVAVVPSHQGPDPTEPCAYREWAPSRFCPRGLSCASGSITFPFFLPSMLGFISPGTRRGTCANQRMKPALVKPEKKSKLKGEEEKLSLCRKMDSCSVPLELTGAADRDLSLDGSFSHLAHLMLPHLAALPAKLL